MDRRNLPVSLVRLLRHVEIQLFLASARIAADLRSDADCDFLALGLRRELVRASAKAIALDNRALERLRAFLNGPPWSHVMAASILNATRTNWMPMPSQRLDLAGAYLDGAQWALVQLAGANLQETDFHDADLRDANLEKANCCRANFARACLRGACLKGMMASKAHPVRPGLTNAPS